MIRRFWHGVQRLLARLFCPYKQPEIEAFSDPPIVIHAKPRRAIERSAGPEGTIEAFSDPPIVIHAKPRREK